MELSLILGIVGVTGQIVTSRNPRIGWAISLANQPLWIVFALTTGQYGLLLLTAGFTAAAALNLRRARREHPRNRTTTKPVGGGR